MAKIFRAQERDFRDHPGKIDNFRLFSDFSIIDKGLKTENLNFDIRRLDPGNFSTLYHFHRYAEELFVILSGTATLRTGEGFEVLTEGDLAYFERGKSGAHQLYNHTESPCTFLDIRTFTGYDVCEYPDSDKVLLVPSMEIFGKDSGLAYYDGEENVRAKWREAGYKGEW